MSYTRQYSPRLVLNTVNKTSEISSVFALRGKLRFSLLKNRDFVLNANALNYDLRFEKKIIQRSSDIRSVVKYTLSQPTIAAFLIKQQNLMSGKGKTKSNAVNRGESQHPGRIGT